MLQCSQFFGKKTIDTYYEFLFAMALAAECGRRGTQLDMRDMIIKDKGILSDDDISYMHYLRGVGCIDDGSDCSMSWMPNDVKPTYYFDTDVVTELYDSLFQEDNNCYYWCTSYAYANYDRFGKDVLNRQKIGISVLHLTAHLLVCFYLQERVKKEIVFHFASTEVATIHLYCDLYACTKTIQALGEIVKIDLDENYLDSMGDIDLYIHYRMARHSGRWKLWSKDEKISIIKKMGLGVGSIAVLYERDRVNKSNPMGRIVHSSVIRIDDMSDEGIWGVTQFSVNKTIEEHDDDYLGIDDEYKSIFADMLKPTLASVKTTIHARDVGIGTYFYDEDYLIIPIERDEKVFKKVSIDGKLVVTEFDDVESIYWILNQYGVDFDTNLFREYYNDGQPLMWDMYDGTPVRRGIVSRYNEFSEED